MTLFLQQGETSTLVVYPLANMRGAVSTATVRYGTPAVAIQDEGSGVSGTVSSLSTTTSAEALAGATSIVVASATGATAGRRFLLGATLVCEIESISGTTLTLRLPLPETVASGAAVKGLDLTISIPSTSTADIGNAISEWEVDGGVTFLRPFVISPRSVAYNLDTELLFRLAPRAKELAGSEDADGNDAIRAAWTSEVARHLLQEGLKPEFIISWEELNSWHAAAVTFHLALNSSYSSTEEKDSWHEYMTTQRNSALKSRRVWYSENEGIADRPDDPIGFNRLTWSQ